MLSENTNMYIIGISMGGALALHLASMFPISGIVACATVLHFKDQKKLMLHSYKIKFLINNKKFNFKAKLPDYFNNYLNKKRLII